MVSTLVLQRVFVLRDRIADGGCDDFGLVGRGDTPVLKRIEPALLRLVTHSHGVKILLELKEVEGFTDGET